MRETPVIPITPHMLVPLDLAHVGGIEIPLYASQISAGFPSPAEDYLGERIDLLKYLIKHPTSTYMLKVRGTSMEDAEISEGDILLIDKAIKASDGLPIIYFVDGEFTVKTFKMNRGKAFLMPANPAYSPIELTEEMNIQVWGVVTWIIKKPKKQ